MVTRSARRTRARVARSWRSSAGSSPGPCPRGPRRPRVDVLSTGNELADLGTEPGPGQIPNTNTYSLMAQVVEAGAEPVSLGVVPDRLEAIVERIRWAASADVLVSSAGVSVGELDLVREALVQCGAELHLWKVAMRPGKPITFGSLEDRPVFGLPGNPVSAMVTFELFVRPALRKMAGCHAVDRPRIWARVLEPIRNPGGRRGYLRVTLARDCAPRGAVTRLRADLAQLRSELAYTRAAQETAIQDIAHATAELRALDARTRELAGRVRETADEAARLGTRTGAAEEAVRETRARVETFATPPPAPPVAPPPARPAAARSVPPVERPEREPHEPRAVAPERAYAAAMASFRAK